MNLQQARITRKIENILIQEKDLRLPGKKKLMQADYQIEVVKRRCQRVSGRTAQKKQKRYYSGKKKRHTIKSQIILNQKNGEIICTAYGKGREHDFKLYKRSQVFLKKEVECLADKGYQGIQKIHSNSQTPKKKPRGGELSELDKKQNRELAKKRVLIENVFRYLKIFRILSERYRNRRKRFALRFNLIASLYNFELHLLLSKSSN